jgi:hypothetical protein
VSNGTMLGRRGRARTIVLLVGAFAIAGCEATPPAQDAFTIVVTAPIVAPPDKPDEVPRATTRPAPAPTSETVPIDETLPPLVDSACLCTPGDPLCSCLPE